MLNEPSSLPSGDSRNLLLVVEDNEQDFEIFQRSVKRSQIPCELHRCETGDEALAYLSQQTEHQRSGKSKTPALILLDLNLPGTDGHAVLKQVKLDSQLRLIPIVIFSTSSNPKDVETCYHNGANGYMLKPLETSQFQENVKVLLHYWLQINLNYDACLSIGLNQ
ncbi:MAG: response regulator [Prochlorotrichaceae cyanobacterium]|jgi:CheY-like chemotaxis protein